MRRLPRYCTALIGAVIASMIGIGVAQAASNDENAFADRVNDERISRGIGTLRWDESLARVARRHAQRMADSENLHHNPNLRNEVSGWDIIGENVGYGPNVDELHRAFMDSQSHRDNVLDSEYTLIGTGTVWKDGTLWVTEVFMLPSRSSAAAPRRSRAPSRPRIGRPRPEPATPPQIPVAAPVSAPAPAAAAAPAYLTKFMVENLLGADDPAAGSIHAVDLFVSPADLQQGNYLGATFGPFGRMAARVNQNLLGRAASGR